MVHLPDAVRRELLDHSVGNRTDHDRIDGNTATLCGQRPGEGDRLAGHLHRT